MITVIIATKNRPSAIKDCVSSLLNSTHTDYEIIIADQSTDEQTKKIIRNFRSGKIHYFRHPGSGKTKAVNTAVKRAGGSVLSFIDDDNIVRPDWLTRIYSFLRSHTEVAGVFGTILAYKPGYRAGYRCPSVFRLDDNVSTTDPYITHHQVLGLGSNMSLRKSVIQRVGLFRPWLGPGAFGFSGGEDGDLIYRILRSGYTLAYQKQITVFHNRWLSEFQYRMLQTRYTAGEMAYMTYYSLKQDARMKKILKKTIIDRLFRQGIKGSLKTLYISPGLSPLNKFFWECIFTLAEMVSVSKGCAVGLRAHLITSESAILHPDIRR